MRSAIFNPYLDTLGGGERYTLSFAQVLKDQKYQVDIQWKDSEIKRRLEERFGMKLNEINFVRDIKRGDGYDVCFWVSDGSIPLLRARKNFLHFQFPFKQVNGKSLLNRMKLFRINRIICNSFFTKSFVDEEYGVDSIVIYPPVPVDEFKPKRKENIILYVGRFSQLEQAKNQHILVDIFKKLSKKELKNWRLILAGGSEVGAEDYLKKLKRSSKSYPILIIEKPKFSKLRELYGKAKIFWSAAGFGVNEKKEPKKVEHFGITVVEAMAAGCVPIIYSAGGYKEIVADGVNGFLWKEKSQLSKFTKNLIKNPKLFKTLTSQAMKDSRVYEYERFEAEVVDLLK